MTDTEVPEDIRETAAHLVNVLHHDNQLLKNAISQALLTERNTTLERAAVIAGNACNKWGMWDDGEEIAAAIRREIK